MTPSEALEREAWRLHFNAAALDRSHPSNAATLKAWREHAERLRKAAADVDEAAKCLAWALDLLDLYDQQALNEGHSETAVLSELHIEAKVRARAAVAALTGIGDPTGCCTGGPT